MRRSGRLTIGRRATDVSIAGQRVDQQQAKQGIMQAPVTLTEAICAAILCLYAVGTSRGADQNPTLQAPEKSYQQAIARAEVLYQVAQDVCEKAESKQRDLCLKEAKATHIRAVSDAKARLKAAQMVSYQREGSAGVQSESRW
jgi:hypothetical protein